MNCAAAIAQSRGPAIDTFNHLVAQLSDFGADAKAMALKQLMLIVYRQAVVMAFADVFLLLSLLFVALAALAIVMKRPTPAAGEVGAR